MLIRCPNLEELKKSPAFLRVKAGPFVFLWRMHTASCYQYQGIMSRRTGLYDGYIAYLG